MRVHLITFGCRANQYDSERVAAMVRAGGGEVVEAPTDADVVVLNSCAVTREAEADLRQQARRVARAVPAAQLVVMGCAAARAPGALSALPNVVEVVAGDDLPALAQALHLPRHAVEALPTVQQDARGLLRIQDGCDQHCTFCATTLARGANRSRPIEALVTEAQGLAATHPEIVLTGVHIGTYGHDRGTTLAALVHRLVREVPAVRFRLSSLEATEVDAALLELLTGAPARVAPFLHAPVQSGSDAVLRRMGRHWYTAERWAAAVARLLARTSVFGVGVDLMAGFPGETDADHAATCALLRDLPLTAVHVFPYSPRPGTAAERLPGAVPEAVKRARAAELRALGESQAAAYRRARAGGMADLVVVGRADGHRRGLSEDYLAVELPAPVPRRRARVRARLALADDGAAARLVALPLS